MKLKILTPFIAALAVLASAVTLATPVNQQAIGDPGSEWLSHGRDYQEQRFSPLTDIDTSNVSELDLVWAFEFSTARGMEATPLIHDGVIYISTGWSHVHALDARSGEELWHFDAEVNKAHLVKTCCGPVNRGVALWQADAQSPLQLFFGALDGRLIALDAATGQQNWSVQTTPENSNYSITGAPRVMKGLVVIGNGGADLGARGFVSAYDAHSGERRWRFYTTPGDPAKDQENAILEQALETWNGDYWYQNGGGGGTVWDTIVYDEELDQLYIGTGNGSPWNRQIRSPGGGDNLFLSSIVALNPDTGKYLWHYQTTPAENWDYTATQNIVLADLELQRGPPVPVLMQAPKNGFFYVLDRRNGELISADAYSRITWASHVDMETGRPVETEYADYQSNGGSAIWPGPFGAHNWPPMSFSPDTGLMYIPAQSAPSFYRALEDVQYRVNGWHTGIDLNENRDPKSWVAAKAAKDALLYGELVAWDPVRKQRAWVVRHPHLSNGGILTTAGGLVFQGTGTGLFAAYNATNGEKLWAYQSDSAIHAGPISYSLDGEQYVAVAQGRGGAIMLAVGGPHKNNQVNRNRLLVFKKGSFNQTLKMQSEVKTTTLLALGHEADTRPEIVEKGGQLFERNCSVCHGISATGNGVTPDLRYMSEQTHTQFAGIVYGGALTHKGMVGYYESLSLGDVSAIHAYLDSEQQQLSDETEMSFWQEIEYWFAYWGAKLGEKYPSFMNATRDYML